MKKEEWDKISDLELKWWKEWKSRYNLDDVREQFEVKAEKIKKYIRLAYDDIRDLKILDVGPAATAEINFLKEGHRYAIDPHADFFKNEFPELVDPRVDFIEGLAEELPYPDNFFNVILMMNVLDHCFDPEKALKEMHRCLCDGGMVILRVTVYNRLLWFIHKLFGFVDREHPFAFTAGIIDDMIGRNFDVIAREFMPSIFPNYDPIKRTIFNFLNLFKSAPVLYNVAARKKCSSTVS